MTDDYTTPDVRQLREESCPPGAFPGGGEQDFRVYFDKTTHASIARHAAEDTSVEIGGVLVGKWESDSDGPFVVVSEFIACDPEQSKAAEVTFTHDTWTKINREMDTRFADLSIVGWYHSHPDFGIFLSERDSFIQEHFFSSPGQIAYVVDPVRRTEGVFTWRDGRPALCPHYWVGHHIHIRPKDDERERPNGERADQLASPRNAAPHDESPSASPSALTLLSYLAVFLIGYLVAGKMGQWERTRLVEGTVAHYGIWKGLRPGLGNALDTMDSEFGDISSELRALAAEDSPLAGDELAARRKKWQEVRQHVSLIREVARQLKNRYALTPEEIAMVERLIVARVAGPGIREETGRSADSPTGGESAKDAVEAPPPPGERQERHPPETQKAGNKDPH